MIDFESMLQGSGMFPDPNCGTDCFQARQPVACTVDRVTCFQYHTEGKGVWGHHILALRWNVQ